MINRIIKLKIIFFKIQFINKFNNKNKFLINENKIKWKWL